MSETQFPPPIVMPISVRKQELETVKFLLVRKAVTDTYRKPDGNPLMTYHDTLGDRAVTRQKIIDYELAKGWIIDDGSQQASVIPIQPVQPAIVEQAAPAFVPQQAASIALPTIVVEVQQPTAPPQLEAPAEMVTSMKRRTKAPNLGNAVAPPPMSMMLAQEAVVPPPPVGATVIGPVSVASAVPSVPNAPQFLPSLVQQQATNPPFTGQSQASTDPGLAPMLVGLIDKVNNIGQGVSFVSEQVSQLKSPAAVQEQITELSKTVEILLLAVHHIYSSIPSTATPANGQISNILEFRKYISKFLPQ